MTDTKLLREQVDKSGLKYQFIDVRTGERKEFESLDHAKWFLFNLGVMPYDLDQFGFLDTEAHSMMS